MIIVRKDARFVQQLALARHIMRLGVRRCNEGFYFSGGSWKTRRSARLCPAAAVGHGVVSGAAWRRKRLRFTAGG